MKTKTYVLTLSAHFPKGHPREGMPTRLAESLDNALLFRRRKNERAGMKIHTIRADYGLWKHRIDEVNAGRAVLSVRQWLGAPRRSKQRELFRLDRDSGIGVEKLKFGEAWEDVLTVCNDELSSVYAECFASKLTKEVAENDGLPLLDWRAWFRDYDRTQPMAIIHFTKFRYCILKEGSLPL